MLNGSGNGKGNWKVGDFAEGIFVADSSVKRRGVVVEVMGPLTVVIKGLGFETTCESLRLIAEHELTVQDRNLKRQLAGAISEKGGR